MKRGTRPFIVEVRRGQKRTLPIDGEEEINPLRNEALRRAEVALFGPAPPQAVKPEPVSSPEPRQILASLAEAEPAAAFDEEPAPERRRGRKPGKLQKPAEPQRAAKSRLVDKTARSVPLTPELVTAALDKIEKATLAVPRRPAGGPSSVSPRRVVTTGAAVEKTRVRRKNAAPAGGSAESKQKRSAAKVASRAQPPQPPEIVERVAPRPPQSVSAEQARSPRPSIRGRYVFGTDLKPGERWKRRLRHLR